MGNHAGIMIGISLTTIAAVCASCVVAREKGNLNDPNRIFHNQPPVARSNYS